MYGDDERTFKIICRADEGYCVTVRDDAVVLAPADPSDEYQARQSGFSSLLTSSIGRLVSSHLMSS